jgi:phosphoribosylaminoimidazolecarboxamide formyltransferase/IMP cyclohydrolase
MGVNIVEKIDNSVSINHVLISVYNKAGLETFIPKLIQINPVIKIYSTGGTYKTIESILGPDAKKNLMRVSDYTGQPEMQGGLVKTLDFKIYLGLLSETYNNAHKKDLERTGAVPIDIVVVNLYPFTETIAQPDVTAEKARAYIDIGGPCMVRAAAKNYLRVVSVTDPADYRKISEEMEASNGFISLKTRFECAKKAFAHTAMYDRAITDFLAGLSFEKVVQCYRLT